MANTTITQRDFLNAVIAGNITDEIIDYAKASIIKLDERNEKRKTNKKETEKQAENAKLAETILSTLETGVVYTASQIATDNGITTPKASAILRKLVEAGKLTSTEVKIKACKAEGIKGGKVKGYSLVERVIENEVED